MKVFPHPDTIHKLVLEIQMLHMTEQLFLLSLLHCELGWKLGFFVWILRFDCLFGAFNIKWINYYENTISYRI